MSDAPFIPFYTSDFIGGTSGMTASSKGVYITLLCLMYEAEQPLKQSYETLARHCGCTVPAFKKALLALQDSGKMTVSDAGIWSQKCDKHIAQRRERRNSAKAAAKTRWEKTKQKQSSVDATACNPQCQPKPEPEPESENIRILSEQPLPTVSSDKPEVARIETDRGRLDMIEHELRQAAGCEQNPSPGLMDLSPILGLLDAGADLSGDILPAIRVRPSGKARSWAYFVPQIKQAMSNRQAARDAPMPPPDSTQYRSTRQSRRDEIAAIALGKVRFDPNHQYATGNGTAPDQPGNGGHPGQNHIGNGSDAGGEILDFSIARTGWRMA